MSKETFREAIFNVVEFLTQHALYDNGRNLVVYYFNDSRESTAYERALYAIEKYFPESLPPENERSPRLEKLLNELQSEAAKWDND
ncbi:MAG TPA: hypothetical protein VF857_00240 [Spirochaetota bacterium]